MGITYQFLSFGIILSTNSVSTILIDRLRHQSQMPHNRNTCAQNTLYSTYYFFATFQFQGICMTLFHNADGRSKTFHLIALVRTERHIHYNHSTFYSANYRLSMIDHLIKGDRKCRHITSHYITGRITHKDYIHTCTIHNLCHSVIIGCQHRNFFASLLHFNKAMSSHFTSVI